MTMPPRQRKSAAGPVPYTQPYPLPEDPLEPLDDLADAWWEFDRLASRWPVEGLLASTGALR